MRVAVGSTNPVKRRAVETALPGTGIPDSVTVDLVAVDSGVPEQPRGHAQTRAGARNRSRNALQSGAFDLGIGLEGGVATVEDDALFLVMWASVTDGDRGGQAAGPSFPLPEQVAERIAAGAELGPVMDALLDERRVARRGGAAAALTGDRVDRATALSTAVAGALGPFVVDLY